MNDILTDIFRDIRPVLNERLKGISKPEAQKIKKSEIVYNPRTGTARLLDKRGEKLLFSKTEAAELLGGLSLMSVNRRIADGTLPCVHLGGRVLIPREGLVRLIAERMEIRKAN
ncbi:MAG: helix-turn-helix domain-containing protein [Spirochaetes bacterium]|nr:helix-turn-helix domain-containing protein [Spirochaetota bacterium]